MTAQPSRIDVAEDDTGAVRASTVRFRMYTNYSHFVDRAEIRVFRTWQWGWMPRAMRELAGKEPVSSGVEDGEMTTTTWAGGNEQFKVFLFNKTSRSASGGLLTVTIVSKE